MSSDEKKYLIAFGKSLKKLRLEHTDKSMRLLAYEAGVPPSTLCRLENGQRMATIISLKRLAWSFGWTLDEFLKEVEKNIPDEIKNFDV